MSWTSRARIRLKRGSVADGPADGKGGTPLGRVPYRTPAGPLFLFWSYVKLVDDLYKNRVRLY